MCDLMIIEKKIISIRNIYISNLKSSSSYCGPAFETPLVTTEGPSIVQKNKEYLVKINYAFVRNYYKSNISTSANTSIIELKNGFILSQIMNKKDNIFSGKYSCKKPSGEYYNTPFSIKIKCFTNSTK